MTSTSFDLPGSLLEGRVAVITGSSQGLGAGIARRFAQHGLLLGLCARTEPVAPAGATAVTASIDVTDAVALERFSARVRADLGPIDIWINNAGVIEPMGPQRDHDPQVVERALAVNIGGVANGTRAFTRGPSDDAVRSQGPPPLLVNISSGAATSVYSGWSIYGACKAAVDHFTRIVAVEEPGVRCHSVAPGVVDTAMQQRIRTHDETTFPAIDRFRDLHATASWNSPAWVADHLLAIYTGALVPDEVVYRVPSEPISG